MRLSSPCAAEETPACQLKHCLWSASYMLRKSASSPGFPRHSSGEHRSGLWRKQGATKTPKGLCMDLIMGVRRSAKHALSKVIWGESCTVDHEECGGWGGGQDHPVAGETSKGAAERNTGWGQTGSWRLQSHGGEVEAEGSLEGWGIKLT